MAALTAKAVAIAAQSLRGAIGYGDAGLIARERTEAAEMLPRAEQALQRMIQRAEDADLIGAGPTAGRKADAFEAAVRDLRAALSTAGGA